MLFSLCGLWRYHASLSLEAIKKGAAIGIPCFYHHHNTSFFGLSKCDAPVAGTRVKDWMFPSPHRIANHRKDVLHILQPRAIALPPTTPRVNAATPPAPSAQPAQQAAPSTAVQQYEPPIDMDRVI